MGILSQHYQQLFGVWYDMHHECMSLIVIRVFYVEKFVMAHILYQHKLNRWWLFVTDFGWYFGELDTVFLLFMHPAHSFERMPEIF